MATNKELELKVESMEKNIFELQNAIRKISQENNEILKMVSKVNDMSENSKTQLETLKKKMEKISSGNISKYK